MVKGLAVVFITALLVLVLAIAVDFGVAQSSMNVDGILKPSVPEFTIKIVSAPYDVPATHSIDPYTGEEITHPSYHVENKSTQIWIKNQPFTPYEIQENDANWIIDLFYNIRLKGHFSPDWFYIRYHNGSSDGNLRQAYDSEYTVVPIDSYLPSEGEVDFQIEALIGYEHGVISFGGVPGTPRIVTGESSGWSEIQTMTIGESQTTTPSPATTPTPYQEPQPIEQLEIIIGVAVTVAVIGAGLGLLLYLIKKK
jgi:hypothetical protein